MRATHDKPSAMEMDACAPYLEEELHLLKNSRVVLALGKIAFDSFIDFAKKHHEVKSSFKFHHGERYFLSAGLPTIFASYHPRPRNTNTGKMTSEMFTQVLEEIKAYLTQD